MRSLKSYTKSLNGGVLSGACRKYHRVWFEAGIILDYLVIDRICSITIRRLFRARRIGSMSGPKADSSCMSGEVIGKLSNVSEPIDLLFPPAL